MDTEFALTCLTIIALVAIVYGQNEVARDAIKSFDFVTQKALDILKFLNRD